MFSGRGFLIGLTQWLNASTEGNPDQPFSARSAIEADKGARRWIITEAAVDLLFAIISGERDHCRKSRIGPNARLPEEVSE